MRRRTLLAGFAALASAQIGAAPAQRFPADMVARGHYLAIAGDCAACHTAPGPAAPPMAGGYPIVSPLGTIYSSNITPSRGHGIGNYSLAQFSNALRKGIRADGARLYPAMPYTSYAGLRDDDVQALYAYFLQGVAPVDRNPPKTGLPFPFNLRVSMMAWNALFLKSADIPDDPAHDASWNRGRYLAQTLGHCSTCHSPRGLLMQESQTRALSGAPLGEWYAPNITSDEVSGIGGWSQAEIRQYLATGHVPGKAQAAGDMADAITKSFSKLTDADVAAIADYIASVPPVRADGDMRPSYSLGGPVSVETMLRGATHPSEGARLFSGACASCHGADGSGSSDGVIPSLFHNSTTGSPRPDNLVAVILHGVDRTVGTRHVHMPAFGATSFVQPLSDRQIAILASFVRQTFGPGDTVSPEVVALARAGGLPSRLVLAIRILMAFAAAAVLFLAARLVWRGRSPQTRSEA